MQENNLPAYKFPVPFASDAEAGTVTYPLPTAAQGGGRASLSTGFTQVNLTPVAAGGVPPWGADMNGVLLTATQWLQWNQAGGVFLPWDATFSAEIGGYPSGAIVASAVTEALYWRSTADNNTTNADAGGAGWVQFPTGLTLAKGECYFGYTSPILTTLGPYNGCNILVGGQQIEISQSSPPTLSNAGLLPNTRYFIYLIVVDGVPTLIASTIGHYTDATAGNVGIQVMAGTFDNATLVGMAVTNSVGQFQVQGTGTASWFNPQKIALAGVFFSGAQTMSTTAVILTAAANCPFACFEQAVTLYAIGQGLNNTTNGGYEFQPGLDGVPASQFSVGGGGGPAVNQIGACVGIAQMPVVEGSHVANAMGSIALNGIGTATIQGQVTVEVFA
jgi:hypothetical protein